jgi:hypothetical protein
MWPKDMSGLQARLVLGASLYESGSLYENRNQWSMCAEANGRLRESLLPSGAVVTERTRSVIRCCHVAKGRPSKIGPTQPRWVQSLQNATAVRTKTEDKT